MPGSREDPGGLRSPKTDIEDASVPKGQGPVGSPLNRVSTVDAVADALRRRILEGDLSAGTRLKEAALVETHGVARHSIRAALQKLVHEGLLRHEFNRGVFVPAHTEDDIADLNVIRRAIESEGARIICSRRLPVDEIEHALSRLQALPADAPWSELILVDLKIHSAIVAATGSRRMQRAYGELVSELLLALASIEERKAKRPRPAAHRPFVRALADHDGERAVRLLRNHLSAAASDMTAAVRTSAEEEPSGE